jgi:hypothetical protein
VFGVGVGVGAGAGIVVINSGVGCVLVIVLIGLYACVRRWRRLMLNFVSIFLPTLIVGGWFEQ